MKVKKSLRWAVMLALLAFAPSAFAQCYCQGQSTYSDEQWDCQDACDGYIPYIGNYDTPGFPCWNDLGEYCVESDPVELPQEEPDTTCDQPTDDTQPPTETFDDPKLIDDRNRIFDYGVIPPFEDDCKPEGALC